jgi:hypothetical protein
MLIPYQYADGYRQITAKNSMNRKEGWSKEKYIGQEAKQLKGNVEVSVHYTSFSGISIQVATATVLRGNVPLTTDTAFKFSMHCSTISFLSRYCSMT